VAVPKRKTSKAKRRSRRAQHDRITLPNVTICENCGADMLSHHACSSCGYYRGRVAVIIAAEVEAAEEAEE
jgi:large subunit ribosomal protein L32